RRAIRPVVVQIAAEAVHQAGDRAGARRPWLGDGPTQGAGRVVDVHRLRAVVIQHFLELCGNGVVRFFPGDALEFAFAALADALHRVLQPVGVVDALADRAATRARTHLLAFAIHVVAGVVGLDADDLAVPDGQAERAAAGAVHQARAPDGLLFGARSRVLGAGCAERQTALHQYCRAAQRCIPLDEAAPVEDSIGQGL